MTNQIQVFNNSEFGDVRTLEIDGKPYFVGRDVAAALGYSNTRDALAKHVDYEDKNTVAIRDGNKGNPKLVAINESGLYSLIFASKLPSAKRFKRWVTSEVLPMLRKTGKYSLTDDEPEQPSVSLKERMEIAKLIAKTPKNRLHMVVKIFEPVLGVEITPQIDTSPAGIDPEEATEIIVEFIESYDNSILRKFEDGSKALNNKLFKDFLGKRKVNFYKLTKILANTGVIRQEDDGRISSVIYYQNKTVRAIIINPDVE